MAHFTDAAVQHLDTGFYLRFCGSGGGTRTHTLRTQNRVELTVVLVGQILDPVSPELEAALTRTEWELTDDTEGQLWSNRGLGQTEEDTEGQAWSSRGLRPVEEDDTEGQLSKWGIAPLEGEDDDVVGLAWSRSLMGQPDEDVEGQVRVRLSSPEGQDGASGQAYSWRGLGQAEDDTEGQIYIRFEKPGVP